MAWALSLGPSAAELLWGRGGAGRGVWLLPALPACLLGARWACPGRGLLWGAACRLQHPTLLGSGPGRVGFAPCPPGLPTTRPSP